LVPIAFSRNAPMAAGPLAAPGPLPNSAFAREQLGERHEVARVERAAVFGPQRADGFARLERVEPAGACRRPARSGAPQRQHEHDRISSTSRLLSGALYDRPTASVLPEG
jgi:hypothetical protein